MISRGESDHMELEIEIKCWFLSKEVTRSVTSVNCIAGSFIAVLLLAICVVFLVDKKKKMWTSCLRAPSIFELH